MRLLRQISVRMPPVYTPVYTGGRDAAALQVEFLAQGFGEAAYRELRSVVAAHAGLGEQAEHAGRIDDMPVAAGLEVRQECLGAMHHSPEVDADDPFQVGVIHAFDGARQRHPGIIEDQVDLAVLGHAACCPIVHGLAVGHVQHLGGDSDGRQGRGADQRQGLFQALAVFVCQRQMTPFPRQGQGQCAAHAGSRARDRRDAAVE